MKLTLYKTTIISYTQAVGLFLALFVFVLYVNQSILHFDMMYFEQPTLYLLNQKITSLSGLFSVYLHPKMLDALWVPFFRPSGHFFLYQLLTPWLGWHNTKGMLVVNLFFLALSGFMMIRIYSLLFPGLRTGGYLAFAIFLMHPAMMFIRMTPMHFEFAYIFFVLLALDYFLQFCKKNRLPMQQFQVAKRLNKTRFYSLHLLFVALVLYFVAVTFKEPALMLGPVFISYFCINLYHAPAGQFIYKIFTTRETSQILGLIMLSLVLFTLYISLQWPFALPPVQHFFSVSESLAVLNKLIKIIFCLPFNIIPFVNVHLTNNIGEMLVYPTLNALFLWFFLGLTILSSVLLFTNNEASVAYSYRKSLVFLSVTAALFIFLPIAWAHALPWHVSLTLVFVSLALGFGFEYASQYFMRDTKWVTTAGVVLAVVVGLTTAKVVDENIVAISHDTRAFAMFVDRNAVLHPPVLQNKLNADSVVVVEDSSLHNDYALGNSIYPFSWSGTQDSHRTIKGKMAYEYPYVYGGTLFRWAYLMPTLKEQVYPFNVEKMRKVGDDSVIYNWLQHYNNIVCLGYDTNAQWTDKTAEFKKNLLLEKLRRHLVVNSYHTTAASALDGKILSQRQIPIPDSALCKMACDKSRNCKGFTYINTNTSTQCVFYKKFSANATPCATCTGYVKDVL